MSLLKPGCDPSSFEQGMPPEAKKVLALLNPDEDVVTTLTNFGAGVLKTFHSPQKIATWRMVIAATAHNPEMGRLFYENGPARGMKLIERYFEGVMDAGKLRRADARVTTAHFLGLLESEVGEPGLFNARPELTDEHIAGVVERAVEVFMRAYGPASV